MLSAIAARSSGRFMADLSRWRALEPGQRLGDRRRHVEFDDVVGEPACAQQRDDHRRLEGRVQPAPQRVGLRGSDGYGQARQRVSTGLLPSEEHATPFLRCKRAHVAPPPTSPFVGYALVMTADGAALQDADNGGRGVPSIAFRPRACPRCRDLAKRCGDVISRGRARHRETNRGEPMETGDRSSESDIHARDLEVMILENKLRDASQELVQAFNQNEKLVNALHEARERMAGLKEEVDRLSAPPATYGVYLSGNDDGTVNVLFQGRKA